MRSLKAMLIFVRFIARRTKFLLQENECRWEKTKITKRSLWQDFVSLVGTVEALSLEYITPPSNKEDVRGRVEVDRVSDHWISLSSHHIQDSISKRKEKHGGIIRSSRDPDIRYQG